MANLWGSTRVENWNIEGQMMAAQVNYQKTISDARIFVSLRSGAGAAASPKLAEFKIENLDDRGFIARSYSADGSNISAAEVLEQDLYLDYLVHS